MEADMAYSIDFQDVASDIRIGVVICECGGKIGHYLDVNKLKEDVLALPGVACCESAIYPCSRDGQEWLGELLKKERINRLIIGGCTPRLVEKLFQKVAESTGIQTNFVSVVDIREHCSMIYQDQARTLQDKAASLVRMGVARVNARTPLKGITSPIVRSSTVIGSGLTGLSVALYLAESQVPVTLLEEASELGGSGFQLDPDGSEMVRDRLERVKAASNIRALPAAKVLAVDGYAGNYTIRLVQAGKELSISCGSIVLAADAQEKGINGSRWLDRKRVKSQSEFMAELKEIESGRQEPLNDVVVLLCDRGKDAGHCSRICCLVGIQQAIAVKKHFPSSNVTVLYDDLIIDLPGNNGRAALALAKKLGVTFIHYPKGKSPLIGAETVDVLGGPSGELIGLPYDRVILAPDVEPQQVTRRMGALLDLPHDDRGFITEARLRLRPEKYIDTGVYVAGGAHAPTRTQEALFQAYMTGARVLRFLSQDEIIRQKATAAIDPELCTGCGSCVQVCPVSAIRLEKRDGILSLSEVSELKCIGCGNCSVVCPVKAITVPGLDDFAILAEVSAGFDAPGSEAPLFVFACEWSAYAASDMAGSLRLQYPANVRIIRMNCSARFDPMHVLWALTKGAKGVLLGACKPGECHYGHGNQFAKERIDNLRQQLAEFGVDPERVRLEYIAVDDGPAFVKAVNDFQSELDQRALWVRMNNLI